MNPLMHRWTGWRTSRSDCRWLSTRLGLYLEGALGPRAMVRANTHLDGCPSCHRSAALLEDSLKAARALCAVSPSRDFEESVWEKIRISREIQRQPSWRRSLTSSRLAWWGGGAIAFTGAAAATFYFVVLSAPGPVAHPGSPASSVASRFVAPSSEVASTAAPAGAAGPVTVAEHVPSPAPYLASAPQAGDEMARPAGPESTVASTDGTARLEPGSETGELYLEDIQLVPDPNSPDRSYVVRQAVVATPGTVRLTF